MLKRKKHFMNSALSIRCIYSCAVDSFLEVASQLFLPYLSDLTVVDHQQQPEETKDNPSNEG